MTAAIINLEAERDYARLKELLTAHPEIMERTFAALNEEIPMGRIEQSLTIRVDASMVEQMDELVPVVAAMPEFAVVGRITRSTVARLAIMKGLEVLREQSKAG
jgi:hypothetical protein